MADNTQKIATFMAKEEDILVLAVAKSLKAVNEKPIAQNIRDFEAAKEALESFRRKKHEKENPKEARFSVLEAVDYLKAQGYKTEKSKLYNEKAIVGYITVNNAVTFLKKDLDKYAKKFLTLLSSSDADNAEEKMKWDARIAEQKFKDMEFEAKIKQRMYILRSDVEQMLAARAAFLKDNLGTGFIHTRASKIAEILKGNPDNTPELIEFWLKQTEEVFDFYSKPLRFEAPAVLIESEEIGYEND